MNEDAFLQALLADAGADDRRLVYADWLEEQGDAISAAKAEFLRVSVDLENGWGLEKGWRRRRRKRLQQIAAALDTDWLAVVSRLAVENCHRARAEENGPKLTPFPFTFLCERRWEDLQPTDDRAVRFCEGCQQRVFYCDTITEARRHAREARCIAVDLGVIRRKGDLEEQVTAMGDVSEETLRREDALARPDRVSAERERRKWEKRLEEH